MFFNVPRKGRGSLVRRESKLGCRYGEARLRLESLEARQMLSASPLLSALAHLGPLASASSGSAMTLHVTPPSSYYGQSVEMTAKVPGVTSGTVEFLDNGTELTAAGISANGVANYNTSDLTMGSHTITAEYTPAGGTPESATATEQVNAVPTRTMLTATGNPVVITGSNTTATVTFTATVTGGAGKNGQGMPTGSVTFTITGGSSGPTATQVNLDATGKAVYSLPLGQGTYTVSAMYTPDSSSNYATSDTSKPLVESVVTSSVLTSGSVSTNGASVTLRGGQSVTIDVSQDPSSSSGIETGTISYSDGSQIDLAGAQISAVVFSSNNHQAEITGTATNNGTPVTFAMLVDSGSGGWFSQPSVTMVISGDGINYQATSRVSQGSIVVDGSGSSLLPPLSTPAHGQALQSLLHEWGGAIRDLLHGGSGWRL
jgi:hypothetical protein